MTILSLGLAACVSAALVLWPTLSGAQGLRAGVVTQLQGKVTTTHESVPKPIALKYRDDVFLRDKIVTGDQSLARVLLGGKALLTIREHSLVTITEAPGRSAVDLKSGRLSLAVAREKLQPGETVDIRTPNAIAAVRGTVVVADASGGGAIPLSSTFFVVHDTTGKGVGVTQVNPTTGASVGAPLTLLALQRFDAIGTQLGHVSSFPVSEIHRINPPVPISQSPKVADTNNDQLGPGQMQNALLLSNALDLTTPPPPPNPIPTSIYVPPVLNPGGGSSFPGPGLAPAPPSLLNLPAGPSAGSLIQNGGFETGGFTGGWIVNRPEAGRVISSFGSIGPPQGSFMALIQTRGGADAPAPGQIFSSTTLSQTFASPALVLVKFQYDFLTKEFPEFQGSLFNDFFKAQLSGNAAPLAVADVNNSAFAPFPLDGAPCVNGGGFQLCAGGQTGFKSVSTLVPVAGGLATLSFTVANVGDDLFDSAVLLDAVSAVADPPLHFLYDGTRVVWTDPAPLLQLDHARQSYDSLLAVCCGSSASLAGPLLSATDSAAEFRFSVLSLLQGGSLRTSSTEPLVSVERGNYALGSLVAALDVSGVNTATDAATGLTVGTDQPLQHAGVLLEVSDATVTTQSVLKLDMALLEATRPLIAALAGSAVTTSGSAVDLVQQAKLAATLVPGDALVMLDGSTLTIKAGSLVSVGGGSLLSVRGDLVSLTNGSTLNIPAGALVSVSGGSAFTLAGGSLAAFGAGRNTLNIGNSAPLCAGCQVTVAIPNLAGIPVLLEHGATAANVSVGPGFVPFKGLGGLNTVTVGGPSGAVLAVDGPTSRVKLRP
jgi:FecR-like protein